MALLERAVAFPGPDRHLARHIERERGPQVETVLVDDGSSDRSWLAILDFAEADPRVRAISFSRNFGHPAALTCGYQIARCEAPVTLYADLQEPPDVGLDLVDAWRAGADVVDAVRTQRAGESCSSAGRPTSSTACSSASARPARPARRRRLPA